MRWVPPGEFTMGAESGWGWPDERPAHRVRIDGFWIDEHEVTNAEFRRFVEATGWVDPTVTLVANSIFSAFTVGLGSRGYLITADNALYLLLNGQGPEGLDRRPEGGVPLARVLARLLRNYTLRRLSNPSS